MSVALTMPNPPTASATEPSLFGGSPAKVLRLTANGLAAWIELRDGPVASAAAGVLARRFVHQENGKIVTIYLACGRPGPICVHSPDACYTADGYREAETPRRITVPNDGKTPSEFWTARYVRQRADEQNLRAENAEADAEQCEHRNTQTPVNHLVVGKGQ